MLFGRLPFGWGRMKTVAVVKNAVFPFPSAAVLLLVRQFLLQPVSNVEHGSTFLSPFHAAGASQVFLRSDVKTTQAAPVVCQLGAE